jgi:chromosome segregation ATPase
VLYLAEVIQKKGGIIGGGKAELKLLACQRTEQNWSAVGGDEAVAADEASRYSAGTLLLVDLTASKQVQRVQEAGRPLVSILQNFSRLQEKFKTQEEEIEQWKQSLTYQSQELNRREMEMEARREQLEQLEEDFEQLEQQRQEIQTHRATADTLQAEITRKQEELEGAWDHLRGEQRRLAEGQDALQQSAVIDDHKASALQGLLSHLTHHVVPADGFQGQIQQAHELLAQHQATLNHHWQQLEQFRSRSDQMQSDWNNQSQDLDRRWQEWHQAQASLDQAKSELRLQEVTLQSKQDYAQLLNLQIQHHDDLHQKLYSLAEGVDEVNISAHIDLAALEQMPIEALQGLVSDYQGDLNKSSEFVRSQEEELDHKQRELDDIQGKINQANEFDRMTLEAELTDERDAYQFLNETLVGQRRNLKEKMGVLRQHQSVLARRQGKPDPGRQDGSIDLGPAFAQIDLIRQQQAETLQRIDSELEQIRNAIAQAQNMVQSQTQEQNAKQAELKQSEAQLHDQRAAMGEVKGRVDLYQEMLQPAQDVANGLQQRLEEMAGNVAQLRTSGDEQHRALNEVKDILGALMPSPQLAAS